MKGDEISMSAVRLFHKFVLNIFVFIGDVRLQKDIPMLYLSVTKRIGNMFTRLIRDSP